MLLPLSLTASRLALSPISPLFVDRFGRSLQFCHLEFDKEAISDVYRSEYVSVDVVILVFNIK